MLLSLLASLAFVAGPQEQPPRDPLARRTCVAAGKDIERFVANYREYINGYERAGRLSFQFAADLQYELELAARPRIASLFELAHDPEATREECRELYTLHKDFLIKNITSKRLANFAAQRDRRLGR
jgi:hypothetical protein